MRSTSCFPADDGLKLEVLRPLRRKCVCSRRSQACGAESTSQLRCGEACVGDRGGSAGYAIWSSRQRSVSSAALVSVVAAASVESGRDSRPSWANRSFDVRGRTQTGVARHEPPSEPKT